MHVKIVSGFLKWIFGYNPVMAKERITICHTCVYRIGPVCGSCGCFLKAKTRDELEDCPKDKWPKIKEPEE